MSQPEASGAEQKNAFTLLMRSSSRGSNKSTRGSVLSQPKAKRQRTLSSESPGVQQHSASALQQALEFSASHAAHRQPHQGSIVQQQAQQNPCHDEGTETACASQGQPLEQQQHVDEQQQEQQQQQQAAVEAFRRAFSGSGGTGVRPQPFRHYLVLDLEATSNKARNLNPVEIIELSCVLLEVTRVGQCQLLQEFSSFVRPDQHPVLDPFITELCGITQEQVDAAPSLREVLLSLDQWLQAQGLLDEGASFAPVTWTSWDLKAADLSELPLMVPQIAVETECKWRGIEVPWYLRSWVDLKRHYQNKYRKAGNLRSCVEAAGLEWTGHAHSGIDDARNTARLAIKLLQQGARLTITERFEEASSSRGPAAAAAASARVPGPGSAAAAAVGGAGAGGMRRHSSDAGGGAGAGGGGMGRQSSGSVMAGTGGMRQALLAPKKAPANPVDAQGNWNGLCKCGIKAAPRVTKKPGPNHGRQFFSCGNWRITKQGQACDFFLWGGVQAQGHAAA